MKKERIEATREEWVAIGVDDDGTQAFLDVANITQDLEMTTVFKALVKHVLPSSGHTYAEVLHSLKKAKKNKASPNHVKQVVEIDCMKGLWRDLSLIVCDTRGHILDTISFRFPDWMEINDGGILEKVARDIRERFPEVFRVDNSTLKFSPRRSIAQPGPAESGDMGVPRGDNGDSADIVITDRSNQKSGQAAV